MEWTDDYKGYYVTQNTGLMQLFVSNHGDRQLNGAPSSISVLEEIINSIGTKLEVLTDSSIRSGQDLPKAKALGVTAGLIGRPMAYGVGAHGEKGAQNLS
ncbi:hypothetical protein fh0823_26570 [Francisella halioticida]|nr:hypothetical protein fh0823_26570 [Francisella halioticida]